MREEDVPAATAVANEAFGAMLAVADLFGDLLVRTRYLADPAGCFVAEAARRGRRPSLVGMLLSVARGRMGWFGPLAVTPDVQRSGAGRALVEACLAGWRSRGVELMGLETLPDSPFHVRFYSSLGFRPAWTGICFETALPAASAAAGADEPTIERVPDLGFVYPGLDLSGEVAAARATGAYEVLTTDDGMALVAVQPLMHSPQVGLVPFLAAPSRASFDALLGRAERSSADAGFSSLLVYVPGSASQTQDALAERGYRAGRVMVRMKAGAGVDYDGAPVYYCDNWL